MQTYAEMYAAAKKGDKVKTLTPEFMKWEKEGEQIIGAFVSKSDLPSREVGKTYNQYLFNTDKGHVKFSLGQVGDSDYGEVFCPGLVYAITYQGMGKSQTGNEFKLFEVVELELGDYGPQQVPETSKADAK